MVKTGGYTTNKTIHNFDEFLLENGGLKMINLRDYQQKLLMPSATLTRTKNAPVIGVAHRWR